MTPTQLSNHSDVSIEQALRSHGGRKRLSRLTLRRARGLIARPSERVLTIARTADREALELLRFEGFSYHVETTGETYLAPRRQQPKPQRATDPFARRASRIPRWLLLHPYESFTISELAEAADVDKSVASRTVATLVRETLIHVDDDPDEWRARAVTLTEPRRLLEEWSLVWRRRRPIPQRFDIGTRTVERTLRALADAEGTVHAPWAISGIAGAATLRRAVEPADVLLLTTAAGVEEWSSTLLAEPNPDRGLLQIAVAQDAFIFQLADRHGGLPVADPVQLWLDTTGAGERAVVAADAILAAMGWKK